MQTFRECIGDAIIRAVRRDDYTAIISLRKVFDFLARIVVNYDGINSSKMEYMLDDIWMCLDQGVKKNEIERSVMAVMREPSNEDNYRVLSNRIDYDKYKKSLEKRVKIADDRSSRD